MAGFWGAYLATLTTFQVIVLAWIAAKYAKSIKPKSKPPA